MNISKAVNKYFLGLGVLALISACSTNRPIQISMNEINKSSIKLNNAFCFDTNKNSNLNGTNLCGLADQGIASFYGIEYADANRWQKPKLYSYALKTINAQYYGPHCPQNSKLVEPIGPNGKLIKDNEACLNMNIWAPINAIKHHDKLPVVIFIHGGAFVLGSGSQKLYNGANFAKDGMVFVTFNYRLGILGFLHPEKGNASGNYGLMDQQAAIKWVRNNISQFGGDPDNIVLMGESAGAMSVGIYLSNYSKTKNNYITAAIMESNPYGAPYKSSADALLVREKYQNHACSVFSSTCDLNDFSTEELLDLQSSLSSKIAIPFSPKFLLTFEPYIDGEYLKNQPIETKISIPLLMGTNANESDLFVGALMDATSLFGLPLINKYTYLDIETKIFPEKYMTEIKKTPRYTAGSDYIKGEDKPTVFDVMSNLFTDAFFLCPSRLVMENATSENKYGYLFKYVSKNDVLKGMSDVCDQFACHASELPFVFDNQLSLRDKKIDFTQQDKKIAKYMHTSWSSFITSPDHEISSDLMHHLGDNLDVNVIRNIGVVSSDLNQPYSIQYCKIFKGLYQTKEYN